MQKDASLLSVNKYSEIVIKCVSIYLSVCLSVYPSIHLSFSLSVFTFYCLLQGLRTLSAYALGLLLVATFVSQTWSAPKGSFQRRNWTPHAMLYLKGTQGRRFISEDRKEGDVYDTLHLEARSRNTEKLSVSQAAAVLLNFLQQAGEEGEESGPQTYFQDIPVWKRDYF
uniref:Spexin n=1 Tax=Denticeps clupeoides TaxID=299321 RepID=A0AAY4AWD9_9TELE